MDSHIGIFYTFMSKLIVIAKHNIRNITFSDTINVLESCFSCFLKKNSKKNKKNYIVLNALHYLAKWY